MGIGRRTTDGTLVDLRRDGAPSDTRHVTGHSSPAQLLDTPRPSRRYLAAGPIRYRILLFLAAISLIGVAAEYVAWASAALATGRDPSGIEIVPDYSKFHVAGQILDEQGAVAVYDPALFAEALEENTGVSIIGGESFYGHPPFFPPVFVPLQPLGIPGGYAVWMVSGFLCLTLVLRRIGVNALVPAMVLVILSEPGFLTVRTGQFSLWAASLIGGVYLLLRSDRPYVAGALLGLLAFKPILAVGIGLWWLLDGKHYWKAIVGALGAVAVQVGVTLLLAPGSLAAYVELLRDAGDTFVIGPTLRIGFSMREFITLLVPDRPGLATGLWIAASAILVWGFVRLLRARRADLSVMFPAAVVLGTLITPRTGGYDWVLLVIPAAILWVAFPGLRSLWVACGATLLVASFFSMWILDMMEESLGLALQIATIALVVIAVIGWRALRTVSSAETTA